jgi:predicted SAM-dependent methyltransferase
MLKLDLGCGKNKTKSQNEHPFIGVDSIAFDGVDVVHDLRITPWPWEDNSVDEVFSSHFLEHLAGGERVVFFNELHRVMKPGASALIVTPDWAHACAYGDPTHQWPPMSSWYALYLNKEWRDQNAPHVNYTCDFDWMHGVAWDEWLNVRNDEMKQFAMARYVNSVRDLHITLVKRQPAEVNE